MEVQVDDEQATTGAPGTEEEGFYDSEAPGAEGADEGAEEEGANGNGKRTLADLAGDQPDADPGAEAEEEPQQQLFGTEGKITGSVKGARPTSSQIKFKAAAVTVQGQFQPDDVLELRVLARLDKVEFTYTRDKDGHVKGVKRVHYASVVSVDQVDAPDVE